MLLSSVCTPTLIPYLPKLSPPTTRCRLRPPYSISITAATTATTADPNNHFLVEYLVDSIGLPKHEAISASTQVNHLKSPTQPQLLLNLLLKYGFDKSHIREIVASRPKILASKTVLNQEAQIKYLLQDFGLSPSDFVKLIKNSSLVLSRDLDTCIIPSINYLKELLDDDELVVRVVRDSPFLLSEPSNLKKMQLNVEMLRNYGLADEMIRRFIVQNPRYVLHNPERMQDALSRVDSELGIPRSSPMCFRGVCVLASVSKETLQMRREIFRSFGWTDLDISNMSRTQPICLTMSEDRIHKVLNFLMKDLGLTSKYLASRSNLLMYSLDKRWKPRYEVIKMLEENKLGRVKGSDLYTVIQFSESKFLKRYVLPYKDKLPKLYEIYKNREISAFKPEILASKTELTPRSQIKYFLQDSGLSLSDFVKLVKNSRLILSSDLNNYIIPMVNYLKELLDDDELVVRVLRDSPFLLSSARNLKKLQLNVEMLRNYGLADEMIRKFLIQNARNVLYDPERMQDAASRVDSELGIPRGSPTWFRGVCALASVSKEDWQMKREIFRSFGWTDLDFSIMSRTQPLCLTMSEDRVHKALNFLMKELGLTSEYLASRSNMLMYSLDKRWKPRYEVIKMLEENKLGRVKGSDLYTVIQFSESKFLKRYVLPYKDKLPNLYEIYKNRG